ncbi:MAG: UDP-glucose 4-epimerase [Bacteroidetes bacterium GWF2_38_335]|nr:MAG: UDP-glucose 4-epimerase [Bacteroidetes bacterium GWF2_38_335]OFY78154.1 MAG: UDP-glucose 4-epimerase [Bacteroidetes bacterium RIFOXYA12_FULL_38_20]HBS88688.1 UDP-glucose 4-epimerase [Bacteroidales bacterium]
MNYSLVTGGAGFIGAHVTNELIKLNHNVIVLDDLSGGYIDNVNPKALFIKGSITDHKLLEKLFNDYKIDYVYHLAAYAAEGLSHFIKRFNYTNNLIGSVNLINESVKHKIKCFVFTSSIAVYGAGQLPMSEDMVPLPEDPYGISKYAVERDLFVTHEMFGLKYIIFRPHNVYGEYQNIADKYRNVLGIFMNQLLLGKPLTIFGDGTQTRAFSYIGDVAPYIANSVFIESAYNQIINIGADKEYTVNELANTIMDVMKIKEEIRYLPPRNEVQNAYSDHSKAKNIFKIANHISLKEGVEKMAKWVKEHGARETPKFKEIELFEKLPKVWQE